MAGHKTKILAAVSVLTLAACENRDFFADGELFDSWNQEAGSFIDEGYFGNPTMNNTLIHSGDRRYVVNLNNRFASEVPPMVNFAFDSTVLDETSMASLRKQADWIKQFPEIRFRVFGHTDLVGSPAYNKRLGLRRARRVVSYLASQGVNRSRLEAMVSFGETQPLIVTQDRERKNRRTITEVSGFVENNSALLNGKYADVIFREYVTSATPVPITPTETETGE
ncbi:MAG: OmpA family protein [Marinosulfonomonas sp.]|nr:OmpA family protein [Marinosulfonomonas sp.]